MEASDGKLSLVEAISQKLNTFNYDVKFSNKNLNIKYLDYIVSKQGGSEMGILTIDLTFKM